MLFLEQGFDLPSGDTVAPDVSFTSKARWDAAPPPRPGKYLQVVPDLVVEVLSRSTKTRDRGEKKAIYEANGVAEYWLVNSQATNPAGVRLRLGQGRARRRAAALPATSHLSRWRAGRHLPGHLPAGRAPAVVILGARRPSSDDRPHSQLMPDTGACGKPPVMPHSHRHDKPCSGDRWRRSDGADAGGRAGAGARRRRHRRAAHQPGRRR